MHLSKQKIIKRFNQVGVIIKELVKLRSGKVSSFYCDIKKAYGYPDILNALAYELGKRIKKRINCVAASGYGGLPLASLVAGQFNKKFIAVRNEPKKHGRGGYIDGYFPTKNDRVVIIDDVLTTGSSILETFSVLKKTKAKISNAIVVVKRGNGELLPIPCQYLFEIEEIIKNNPARDA